MLAFSIMFFSGALLCFLLGWADGVRHGKTFLHIPETDSFLVATAAFAALGILFLVRSRASRRP
jgi:hypothetical protein